MDNQGTFELKAAATLGTANAGTMENSTSSAMLKKLDNVTTTIAIPFTNKGQFVIQQGTAKFTDSAVQGDVGGSQQPPALTQLNGGTLQLAGAVVQIYQVNDGIFEGIGNVTGSLYMYGGELKLGLNGGPGTLSVSGNYLQTDGAGHSGKMSVYINAAGTCSLLAVTGGATLGGTVRVHNTPYTGTAGFTFLTAGSAFVGDFDSGGISYDTDVWGTPGRHFNAGMSGDKKSYSLTNVLV